MCRSLPKSELSRRPGLSRTWKYFVIHYLSRLMEKQASLVLFLVAKTSITNANRTLAGWETCVMWWSRFCGWVYL